MRASIVIRTLNEGRHIGDLLSMISRQRTQNLDFEIILVDSGSSDSTLDVARSYGVRTTTISKSEFSFGRSLNRGCSMATGEILIFISGHCVPVGETWMQDLCQPLIDGHVSYCYGRQIGDDDSNYSERRIFAKYFPETSSVPQEGFFCNNANSALLRSVWKTHPFNESLTGLEDMELAKRLVGNGQKIGYVADAAVFHHHQESWAEVQRRFEREALALRSILPEVQLSRLDVIRFVVASTIGDWRIAARNNIASTSRLDMLRYRWNQYSGAFKGNREHRVLSRAAKERFFYPNNSEKAGEDEWLRPVRRPSPHEGQQSTRDRKELPSAPR